MWPPLLRDLTGAEAALVVNNNAAAILLALAALAEGREVIVSRGELIEIGDGFRIPDVLARSGAKPRRGWNDEPHASRRLRAGAWRADAAILRVHQSNFRMVGFTEQSSLRELRPSQSGGGLVLVDDLGSGLLRRARRRAEPALEPRRGAHISSVSPETSCSAGPRRESR